MSLDCSEVQELLRIVLFHAELPTFYGRHSLNSSSFGSIKNVPLNCLALSSFGFSLAHLCFAFFFDASDICFHKSGQTLSGREVVCFLVSLPHVYPSGGLSFNKMNLVKPVHASKKSFAPSTFP